jgi:hypothetical protein
MTPPVAHENTTSPTWSSVSGGGDTPANEEGNQRSGNDAFFPTDTMEQPAPAAATETQLVTNEMGVADGWEEEKEDAVMGGTLDKDEFLKVETVYGDSDEEEEAESMMKQRHYFGEEYCFAEMSNGRFCGCMSMTAKVIPATSNPVTYNTAGNRTAGNKPCAQKVHAAKIAEGKRGKIGWYFLDANTSPRQRSQGIYHALAKGYQSNEEREKARLKTREEIEKVTATLGGLDVEELFPDQVTAPRGLKPVIQQEDKKPAPPSLDPMLDIRKVWDCRKERRWTSLVKTGRTMALSGWIVARARPNPKLK